MKEFIRKKIGEKFPGTDFDVLIPPDEKMGDYSTNAAFVLAKKNKVNPSETGGDMVEKLNADGELKNIFEKIEFAKPGFVNFYIKNDFLKSKISEIASEKEYGFNDSMKGKTVMVEFTDPNPFKLFHIGHLMSNIIGESVSRLFEASGAKVIRVTWQGDVGMHIAMAVWAIKKEKAGTLPEGDNIYEKMNYLGRAYSIGSAAYAQEDPDVKKEIEEVNRSIYSGNDFEVNKVYQTGRQWSLDYFEIIYKKLGSKFDRYFFESELGMKGLKIVKNNPDVFEKSEGAVIFRGEKYSLHTRVFINSSGLPVYEAKELGLNKEKFDIYHPDLSVIITGNEINEYFRVLLKVMELIMPDVAQKTKHIGHGMLRLPTGKMSSRTGDVITAESLIEQTKSKLPKVTPDVKDKIAIGAIKYSILKQSPGHDIVFDFEKSLSVKGDSGPYLQYTYARLNNILVKAEFSGFRLQASGFRLLDHELELKLIKRLLNFPDAVLESVENLAPQNLVLYLYEFANEANRFYESVRVSDDDNIERRRSRFVLVKTMADTLKRGLSVLGIDVLPKI